MVTISWWNRNSISRLEPSGIVTFEDAFIRRTKPMRLNRIFAQLDESMSMFPTAWGYFWMSALAVALAKLEFTRALRELTALIYDWTISSSSPSMRRRPVAFEYFDSDCVTSRFSFEASFISFTTLALNERMVLSFNPGNFDLNFRRAAELPSYGKSILVFPLNIRASIFNTINLFRDWMHVDHTKYCLRLHRSFLMGKKGYTLLDFYTLCVNSKSLIWQIPWFHSLWILVSPF